MAKKSMDDAALSAIVDAQIQDAKLYDGSDRSGHREWALKFFEGEVDIPPMGKDRSSVVSRDVADTHGLILPGLLRVFFASDNIAIYEPTRREHEAYADQATDLVNYVVMKECDGYRHFRDAFSDGLLLGNGIIKHWWDVTPEYTTESFSGLSDVEFALIQSDPDFDEILEHEEYPDPNFVPPAIPPEIMGQVAAAIEDGRASPEMVEGALTEVLAPPSLHDCKIKRIKSTGRLRLSAVPAEEFYIERSAKVLDEECRFVAHVQRKTRSDLIKEGYPRKKVEDLPSFVSGEDSDARWARDSLAWSTDKAPDTSTEYIEVFECYVLVDYDGDGIAERRRVVVAGSAENQNILANEEWGDDLPFSDVVPEPRAHTWRGRGIFDEVGDIQRIKTVSMRGVLDNAYQILSPQIDVEVDAYENLDEIVNPTFGGVRLRNTGKPPAAPVEVQYIAPQIFPILEYMDAVGEKRTGVSQRSQALDLDALQNQSATAVNAMQAAAHSKVEEYARNMAEHGGMKRIFSCILKLINKHQDRAKTVRLRGEWVDMDPRGWDADMDVTINTGLGTGSREKDLAMLQGIAQKQEQLLMQFGPFNEKLNIGHLIDTYQKMAEASGVRNADSFFPTISQDEVAQLRQQQEQAAQNRPPDPRMAEVQARIQADQVKLQADLVGQQQKLEAEMRSRHEQMALDAQIKQQENAAKLQAIREEAAAKLQLMREEMAAKLEMSRQELHLRHQERMREMEFERELAEIQLVSKAHNAGATNIPRPT